MGAKPSLPLAAAAAGRVAAVGEGPRPPQSLRELPGGSPADHGGHSQFHVFSSPASCLFIFHKPRPLAVSSVLVRWSDSCQ